MLISELWKEYLGLIDFMTKFPATYSLDQRRTELHEALFKKYSELFSEMIPERFNEICHNLDRIIDFKPPIQKNDSINIYIHDIEKYMMGRGRLYVIGNISKLQHRRHGKGTIII